MIIHWEKQKSNIGRKGICCDPVQKYPPEGRLRRVPGGENSIFGEESCFERGAVI